MLSIIVEENVTVWYFYLYRLGGINLFTVYEPYLVSSVQHCNFKTTISWSSIYLEIYWHNTETIVQSVITCKLFRYNISYITKYVTEINECTDGSHGCLNGATCLNTAGSYTCLCPTGYTGDMCQTGMNLDLHLPSKFCVM